jgi:5-methylcytosine-specific restriction endonuclease McrA
MSRTRIRQIADEMASIEMFSWNDFWPIVEECSEILRELAPMKRRPFMAHVITELYDEQGGACAICSGSLDLTRLHVDHRIPFARGGGNERANLQLVHPRCNQRKGDFVDLRDLIPYLESRYMNRP